MAGKKRVLIMGAAGRDFHNFNAVYRNNPDYEVVAFTATQIPFISGRKYPASLAGDGYPDGIPIYDESELERLIREKSVDLVVFAYSDTPFNYVMERANRVIAAGADFAMLGADSTMLKAEKPVIAVCAVRTGCGKSQTTRRVLEILRDAGLTAAAIRHPMPYGDLEAQKVQRFATLEDMDKAKCTIEEREEYEPHVMNGAIVYAGVDYHAILEQAQAESDVVLWDGGNNDLPFYKPDLMITVVDPLRVGHEKLYHPGMANLLMADVVVINKVDSATPEQMDAMRASIRELNPKATVIEADSTVSVQAPDSIKGKRVLVIEDGPTVTHGGMGYGAGLVAAQRMGAAEIIDPRPFAVGSIKQTFEKYSHLEKVLPAMGYSDQQIRELQETVNNSDADVVVAGTPIDLTRLLDTNKPVIRVTYDLAEKTSPDLKEIINEFIKRMAL